MIKEDESEVNKALNVVERPRGSAGVVPVKEVAAADDDRRMHVEQLLRTRVQVGRRARRFRGQIGKAVKRRVTLARSSVRKGATSTAVVEIVKLYSGSASRYLMFRSNRRYKPGD